MDIENKTITVTETALQTVNNAVSNVITLDKITSANEAKQAINMLDRLQDNFGFIRASILLKVENDSLYRTVIIGKNEKNDKSRYCNTTAQWANFTFGIEKSQTSNSLKVAKQCISYDENGKMVIVSDNEGKQFSFTQCVQLVRLDNITLVKSIKDGKITANMTVATLKKFIDEILGKRVDISEKSDNATDNGDNATDNGDNATDNGESENATNSVKFSLTTEQISAVYNTIGAYFTILDGKIANSNGDDKENFESYKQILQTVYAKLYKSMCK
jgi:hypothetical protein